MPNLELANFVCLFGPDKVLKDYYDEIVLPAFMSNEPRKWRRNEFVLYKVRQDTLKDESGKPTPVIFGRIVKNLTIHRKQLMINGELKKSKKRLPMSPSSFFLFYIKSHKLVYIPEMSFAPTLSDFEYCIAWQLSRQHRYFLREERRKEQKKEKLDKKGEYIAKTIKQLKEDHPGPSLTLTYMSTDKSFADFIRKYNKLKYITIELLPVNEEFDGDAFFESVRDSKERIGSESTKIVHKNPTNGLNIPEAIKTLSHIGKAGNHKIQTDGLDTSGNRLYGDNKEFRLKHPTDGLVESNSESAIRVHGEIQQMINAGVISPGFMG